MDVTKEMILEATTKASMKSRSGAWANHAVSLSMDHREMSINAPATRVAIEPGSGLAGPLGGEIESLTAMEWFSDGESRVHARTPGATRLLFLVGSYLGGKRPAMVVANVPLDDGTVGDCIKRIMADNRSNPQYTQQVVSLMKLLVASETEDSIGPVAPA